MIINRSEMKYYAKERLRGNWGVGVLSTFIIFLITNITNGVLEVFKDNPSLSFSLMMLSLVISWGFPLGVNRMYLHMVEDGKLYFGELFFGFQHLWSSVRINFRVGIFVLLWSFLFIVPGIIKGISYSMAMFIMSENPDMSAKDAMNRSIEMTYGYKWEFFLMGLSFMGWFILSLLTFGIGLLWLIPYFNSTLALYYLKLKGTRD